jgi:hypothetical protein
MSEKPSTFFFREKGINLTLSIRERVARSAGRGDKEVLTLLQIPDQTPPTRNYC